MVIMQKSIGLAMLLALIAGLLLLSGCGSPTHQALPSPPTASATAIPTSHRLPTVLQPSPIPSFNFTPVPAPSPTPLPLPTLEEIQQDFANNVQLLVTKLQASKSETVGLVQPEDEVIYVPATERLYAVQRILGFPRPSQPGTARHVYVLYEVMRGIDLAWDSKQRAYLAAPADTQAVVTTLRLYLEENGKISLLERMDGSGGEGNTSYAELVTKSVLPLEKIPDSQQSSVEHDLEEIIAYACGIDLRPEKELIQRATALSLTLESSEWADKAQGLRALRDMPNLPDSLTPILLAHVSDPRYSFEVNELLTKMGADQGVFAQAIQDANNPDAKVRREAARLLGDRTGDHSISIPILIKLAQDKDASVQSSAVESLITIGEPAVEPLIEVLKSKDMNTQMKAAYGLGQMKDARAIQPLIEVMYHASDYSLKESAANAMGQIGAEAVKPLITLLQDPDPRNREFAAMALGQTNDSRAVEPLMGVLNDANANVRRNSIVALGDLEDPRAVVPITALLKDDNQWVRENAIDVLKIFKDPRAIDPLIYTLGDKEWRVRSYASQALVAIGESAVEPLIAALGNGNANIRFWSAQALAQLNDARAIEPLLARLKAGDLQVIAGAYRFFINQGDIGSEAALIQGLKTQGDVIMANDFLNCGNNLLEQAATDWAKEHYFIITHSQVSTGYPIWGSKK